MYQIVPLLLALFVYMYELVLTGTLSYYFEDFSLASDVMGIPQ